MLYRPNACIRPEQAIPFKDGEGSGFPYPALAFSCLPRLVFWHRAFEVGRRDGRLP